MAHLFSTTGMTVVTVIMLTAELLSFLVMLVLLLAFRRVQRKQQRLFTTLENAPEVRPRQAFLVLIYVVATVLIGLVSMILFVFQPHLL